MPEFTEKETDNSMYHEHVNAMTDEELVKEYKRMLELRRRGGDKDYNLQMCFDIMNKLLETRNINIYASIRDIDTVVYKAGKTPETKQTRLPINKRELFADSSKLLEIYDNFTSGLIECFAYNPEELKLYIKFWNAIDTYPYYNATREFLDTFIAASSKGSFYARLIKGKREFKERKKK